MTEELNLKLPGRTPDSKQNEELNLGRLSRNPASSAPLRGHGTIRHLHNYSYHTQFHPIIFNGDHKPVRHP